MTWIPKKIFVTWTPTMILEITQTPLVILSVLLPNKLRIFTQVNAIVTHSNAVLAIHMGRHVGLKIKYEKKGKIM